MPSKALLEARKTTVIRVCSSPHPPPPPGTAHAKLATGLDAIEKKFGGGKINPEQARGVNEKITDGAREMFEKATG